MILVNIEKTRAKIDIIDGQILSLLIERMKLIDEVVEFKLENEKPIEDELREQMILEQKTKMIQEKVSYMPNYILNVFSAILEESKKYQREKISDSI